MCRDFYGTIDRAPSNPKKTVRLNETHTKPKFDDVSIRASYCFMNHRLSYIVSLFNIQLWVDERTTDNKWRRERVKGENMGNEMKILDARSNDIICMHKNRPHNNKSNSNCKNGVAGKINKMKNVAKKTWVKRNNEKKKLWIKHETLKPIFLRGNK